MALGHPIIFLTQALQEVPFDIRDMQTLQYERTRLNTTLGQPLQRMVVDTMSARTRSTTPTEPDNKLVGQLLSELADLKSMVAQVVRTWNPESAAVPESSGEALKNLAGAWVNPENNTHLYGAMIASDLVVPYCYQGDHALTGAYFGWRRAGDYWFARFAWRNDGPAGFAFLRQPSIDILRGAWWSDTENRSPNAPPETEGVTTTWERASSTRFRHGLVAF